MSPPQAPSRPGDGRLSPHALAVKHAMEMNIYEGMDASLQQVQGIESLRAIGTAQQESLALAQIIKVDF